MQREEVVGGFLIPVVAHSPAPGTHCPAPRAHSSAPVATHSFVPGAHSPALEDSLKLALPLQGMTRGREGTSVKKHATPGIT